MHDAFSELTWLFLLALNAGSLFQLQARIGVPCQQKLSLVLPPQALTLHEPLPEHGCQDLLTATMQSTHVSLKPPPHMSNGSGMSKGLSGLGSSTSTSRILSNGSQPFECCRTADLAQCHLLTNCSPIAHQLLSANVRSVNEGSSSALRQSADQRSGVKALLSPQGARP